MDKLENTVYEEKAVISKSGNIVVQTMKRYNIVKTEIQFLNPEKNRG